MFTRTHGWAISADPAEVPDKSAVILIDHTGPVSLSGNTLTKPGLLQALHRSDPKLHRRNRPVSRVS